MLGWHHAVTWHSHRYNKITGVYIRCSPETTQANVPRHNRTHTHTHTCLLMWVSFLAHFCSSWQEPHTHSNRVPCQHTGGTGPVWVGLWAESGGKPGGSSSTQEVQICFCLWNQFVPRRSKSPRPSSSPSVSSVLSSSSFSILHPLFFFLRPSSIVAILFCSRERFTRFSFCFSSPLSTFSFPFCSLQNDTLHFTLISYQPFCSRLFSTLLYSLFCPVFLWFFLSFILLCLYCVSSLCHFILIMCLSH